MIQTKLAAQVREKTGKGVAHRLRASKMIPAVIYGPHQEKPLTIAVDPKALRAAIQTAHRFNTILTLELDQGGSKTALLKDYQQDPVSRELLHADFYEVALDKPVTVPVPLVLVGKAQGVTEGGILSQNRRVIDVVCLPNQIPEKIEVDVTDMKVNQALHASDVKAPEGIALRYLTDFTIAVMSAPEVEAAAPAAEAAAAKPAKGKK
ncbi:50S ribosomal protein L25 [Vulgatibacter incomptus]|uniref:Large ribosomal subunit protein bL25 n=1 Tax=Vulgatibacter incomptus TaxID=1391653 RepID=A0A0K1PET5_9BACT|nr:50S ribosomal protein L25 [Vulgatibacter incomptus]AKU91926.1 LSU ribosomal protein L25p [Vulgatibacter incomptus]